jgi:Raf kinase inhibitor-like YbhB/YbcL family protein
MSPAFEFSWVQAGAAAMPPATLMSYAVVFHDIENSTARGTTDTLHWVLWDIPGTNKGLAGSLPMGDLPDGTRQGRGIMQGVYFGPGAGPGPYHHYVFEFFALDTKLNLPATATRAEIMAAMEGHVVGKAAYVGRYHQ